MSGRKNDATTLSYWQRATLWSLAVFVVVVVGFLAWSVYEAETKGTVHSRILRSLERIESILDREHVTYTIDPEEKVAD